jgi:transposase
MTVFGHHFGLIPKRYSSGQTDYDGRISAALDAMVRTALFQAANVLLHHGRWSSLRSGGSFVSGIDACRATDGNWTPR